MRIIRKFLWQTHKILNIISHNIWYYLNLEGSYRTQEKLKNKLDKINEFIIDEVCNPCINADECQCDDCNYWIIKEHLNNG